VLLNSGSEFIDAVYRVRSSIEVMGWVDFSSQMYTEVNCRVARELLKSAGVDTGLPCIVVCFAIFVTSYLSYLTSLSHLLSRRRISVYLGTWLDLTTSHRQTWLFSCTSAYHSTDLLTVRVVAHLVVHGTSGSTSYETIPPVRLESCGGVLSTVDMVVQRRDCPRRLRELDLIYFQCVYQRQYHSLWICTSTVYSAEVCGFAAPAIKCFILCRMSTMNSVGSGTWIGFG